MTKFILIHCSYDIDTHEVFDTAKEAVKRMKEEYDETLALDEDSVKNTYIITEGEPSAIIVWDDYLVDLWHLCQIDTNELEETMNVKTPFVK